MAGHDQLFSLIDRLASMSHRLDELAQTQRELKVKVDQIDAGIESLAELLVSAAAPTRHVEDNDGGPPGNSRIDRIGDAFLRKVVDNVDLSQLEKLV